MVKHGTIVVHKNPASPFPMYFYAIEEHNTPEDDEFPGHPGFWYGLYVLPDFLALQVDATWKQFHGVTIDGRRFVVDVGLPMYADLSKNNVVETFASSKVDQSTIRLKMMTFLLGDDEEYRPSERERAFLYHPEYLAVFKLTKRAQGLRGYV